VSVNLFLGFELVHLVTESRFQADFDVFRLNSRSSFEWAIIQNMEFFTPKMCLHSLWFLTISSPISRSTRITLKKDWYRSSQHLFLSYIYDILTILRTLKFINV